MWEVSIILHLLQAALKFCFFHWTSNRFLWLHFSSLKKGLLLKRDRCLFENECLASVNSVEIWTLRLFFSRRIWRRTFGVFRKTSPSVWAADAVMGSFCPGQIRVTPGSQQHLSLSASDDSRNTADVCVLEMMQQKLSEMWFQREKQQSGVLVNKRRRAESRCSQRLSALLFLCFTCFHLPPIQTQGDKHGNKKLLFTFSYPAQKQPALCSLGWKTRAHHTIIRATNG